MLGTDRRCRTRLVRAGGPTELRDVHSSRPNLTGTAASRRARFALWAAVLVLSLGAFGIAQAAPPTVWVAPSLQRVRPDDAAQSTTSISLAAAKGETESFQIIVRAPAEGLTNVNVQAPALGGPTVTLYRESYLYLASGSGDWASNRNKPQGPGWYPDGLIPFRNPSTGQPLTGGSLTGAPFSVSSNKNQPVWVDVYVPPTTPAGTYTGTFTVTSTQVSASVNLTFKVWNFTLPLKTALKSCFMYWGTGSGGQDRGVLQSDSELLRNRLNPVSTNPSYERQLIDTLGLTSISLPFWSNASDSGSMAPAPSVSEIQAAKAQHQQDLYFYCYSADEINSSALYPMIKAWGRALHGAGVDQLITMAPNPGLFDDGSGTGRSAVDDWVMLPKMYDGARSYVLQAQQKGDKAWSYNCLQQDDYSPKWLIDFAPINYRIQPGFINQSLGLVGLLYWRVDWWTSDPWNNVQAWPGYPGEGMLVYPGAQVGLPGQVVPSLRLKYLRDGVDDYDYIELLKKAGYGDWALSLARSIGPDWTNWSRDTNALEAARLQLGARLDALNGGQSLTVTAAAAPSAVNSQGTTALTASAAGATVTSWAWSDGGAGGKFSATTTQNPSYTAPANTSGADRVVTLTVKATAGTASATASTALTVHSVTGHTLSLNAYALPGTVASGGSTSLTGAATDSQGDGIASWSWSDGGAGGTFSSTTVSNPTYRAPANTTTADRTITLTVTATCAGATPLTRSATTSLVVQGQTVSGHSVTVTASATPTTVASGGTVTLSMSGTDSQGHTGLAWQWSDGGAGGTFSSTTAQNPTYKAPTNSASTPKVITLTATAICKWQYPWVNGNTVSIPLTVNGTAPTHTVSVTASASPNSVASAGTTTLTGAATDSLGHAITSWSWSDGGAGGRFSSATAQSPTYTAPTNTGTSARTVTLTLTAGCGGASASGSTALSVAGQPATTHAVTVKVSAAATSVTSGGTVSLTASGTDTQGHGGLVYQWSDGGAGGSFSAPTAATTTYRAPANTSGSPRSITLSVTAACAWQYPWVYSSPANVTLTVTSGSTGGGHSVSVTASASASTVASGASVSLSASALDSLSHGGLAWQWSDNGAGGTFSSTTAQNPTYRAPTNTSGSPRNITLTATAICKWQWPWIYGNTVSLPLTVTSP